MNINLKDYYFYTRYRGSSNVFIFINKNKTQPMPYVIKYDENETIRELNVDLSSPFTKVYYITLPPLSVRSLDFANSYQHTIDIEGVWPIGIEYLTIGNCDWYILIDNPGLPNKTSTNLKLPSTLKRITIEERYDEPLKMNTYLQYILENTEIEVRFCTNRHFTTVDESMLQIEKVIMIKKKVFYLMVFKKILRKELIINISEYLDYRRFMRPVPIRRQYISID
jgi:hypothetical protein